MSIRQNFQAGLKRVLRLLGVTQHDVSDSLDIILAIPVIFLAFFAEAPLIVALSGEQVTSRLLIVAITAGALALGLSLLAPNWRFVLCYAFSFLALRSLIGSFLVSFHMAILLLGVVNIGLAVALYKWQGGLPAGRNT